MFPTSTVASLSLAPKRAQYRAEAATGLQSQPFQQASNAVVQAPFFTWRFPHLHSS
jgi:hypothetical protein